MGMHIFSLVSSGCLACSDSPYRLICQYQFAEIFCAEVKQGFLNLGSHNIVISAVLTLFQHFSDTENRGKTFGKRKVNFLFKNFRSLTVILTAFRMAENDIVCTC